MVKCTNKFSSDISPSMCFLMKWCLNSIRLAPECLTGFLLKLKALVLSQYIGILSNLKPKPCKVSFIRWIWEQQYPSAMYSASMLRNDLVLLLVHQDTTHDPRKWHVPLVVFWSIRQPAKSTPEYPFKSEVISLGCHSSQLLCFLRYLKTPLTAFKWDSLKLDWYQTHKRSLKMIPGLLWLHIKDYQSYLDTASLKWHSIFTLIKVWYHGSMTSLDELMGA